MLARMEELADEVFERSYQEFFSRIERELSGGGGGVNFP